MTPSEFAAKWRGSTRNERAASQEHSLDLCGMLGWGTPNAPDPGGTWYAFEKGAEKLGGGDGFADVWMQDRLEIHANFTGTANQVYAFTLDDLDTDPAEPLRILRESGRRPVTGRSR